MNAIKSVNLELFYFLNSNFGKPFFVPIFSALNEIGEPENFLYHFLSILSIATILIIKKLKDKESLTQFLKMGIACSLTAFFSLLIGLVFFVLPFKYYTGVERPFCSLKDIHVIFEAIKDSECNCSFPSGHIAYCVILITSCWPIFNKFFRIFSLIFLITLAISRIASGAHYPLDILGAIALCLPITLYFRSFFIPLISKLEEQKHYVKQFVACFSSK